MLGMEMMFSNLVGMTPDQMKEAATRTMQLLESAAKNMKAIKEGQDRIEQKLDLLLNEKGQPANGRKRITAGNTDNSNERVQL